MDNEEDGNEDEVGSQSSSAEETKEEMSIE
jgi:hypothetical protein